MDTERTRDAGRTRRALLRTLLGRPGSWTRWIVFSAVWLGVWGLVYVWTESLLILGVAILIDLSWLVVRPLLVGDEDELHAELHRGIATVLREGAAPPEDPAAASDPATWFTRGDPDRFRDAPPPPSAE